VSSWLGDSYCVSCIRQVPPEDALIRLGGDAVTRSTLAEAVSSAGSFDAGYRRMAVAALAGDWSVLLEVHGIEGSRPEVLRALSRGTEVYSAFSTVGPSIVSFAADGELVTAFDPRGTYRRWGRDPERLTGPIADEDVVDPLAFLERVTGVTVSRALFTGTLAATAVTPLLDDPPRSLANHVLRQCDTELAAAVDAAPPMVQRRVAAAEARWWADGAGIADEPAVRDALTRAADGGSGLVADDTPLGRLIRAWCDDAHFVATASTDPRAAGHLAPDQRERTFRRMTAGQVVRAALYPDPQVACYEALRDLPVNPDLAGRREVILGTLR
jgi:hypothetical protein